MLKRENVIFDPTDPRAVALEGKDVLASDYYSMVNAKKATYNQYYTNAMAPFICNGNSYTFIAPIPEPKYSPFINAQEFEPHRDKWLVVKENGARERITFYDDDGVRGCKEKFVEYKEMFELAEFEDGTPFGVKE